MGRRKRTSHKRKTHRRRRTSGMSGMATGLTSVASMVAGAVIGRVLQNKLSGKVNPKILAVGQIGLGMMLPKFMKNKFAQGIGTGMVVNGGVTALQTFGVISAVSGVGADMYEIDYVNGTSDLSAIASDGDDNEFDGMGVMDEGTLSGADNLQSIAGDYDEYSDY